MVDAVRAHVGSSGGWPRPAIQLYNARKLKLIPPQWYTISELATVPRHANIAGLATSRAVRPMQPEFTSDEAGQAISALPGDPLHPDGAAAPTDRHRIVIKSMGRSGMEMELDCNLAGHPLSGRRSKL